MHNRNMNINTPRGWRKGQTIFNFLEWLHTEKKIETEMVSSSRITAGPFEYSLTRMADPFHISDAQLDSYWDEFYHKFNLN